MTAVARASKGRTVAGVTIGISVLAATCVAWNDDARFIVRSVYEEARILMKRRPLERLVGDTSILPERRSQFQLVLDVRRFAAESLAFDVRETYTTFSDIGRDTLVLVLSASRADQLVPHTWWFPVVGRLPYHGYFDRAAGMRAAAALETRGFETYLRPAGAFSTLGWFEDPLLSTAIDRSPTALVELVLHEMSHNTVWVAGAGAFNESFALFAGYRGAEAFFRSRGDTTAASHVADLWQRQVRAGALFELFVGRLRVLYAQGIPRGALLRDREAIFREFAAVIHEERLPITPPFNNAMIVASLTYRTNLSAFDRLYHAMGSDVRSTVSLIRQGVAGASGTDPFTVLATLGINQ